MTDASTRSVSTSDSTLCQTPTGADARSRSGTPRRSATARHDGPDTVCARIFVSRPAPKRSASRRGYRCAVIARPSTLSPRNARREYESLRRSVHEACVNTCRDRSSGSASIRSLRSCRGSGGVRGVGEDEVDSLAHAEDPRCLLVGHLHAVGVLELLDERVEIKRIGLEILLEPSPLVDHGW